MKKVEKVNLSKKNPNLDINHKKNLWLGIGFLVSMGLLYVVLELNFAQSLSFEIFKPNNNVELKEDLVEEPPQTEQAIQTPPPVQAPDIQEVPDIEKVNPPIEEKNEEKPKENQIKVTRPTDETSKKKIELPVEEPDPDILLSPHEVQEQAAYPDGMKEFYRYISENIKYPKLAKRVNIQGKVFVQFVVEKDGSLTDLKVVKGIGSGCDEEAIRVIKSSKKWKPAKQRGRAVRQKMSIPIKFELQ